MNEKKTKRDEKDCDYQPVADHDIDGERSG